jgi:hypothetical protein
MSTADIEEVVHRNLDQAANNGYLEDMRQMTNGELTGDLCDKCSEVAEWSAEQIAPCVASWRAKHPEAQRDVGR